MKLFDKDGRLTFPSFLACDLSVFGSIAYIYYSESQKCILILPELEKNDTELICIGHAKTIADLTLRLEFPSEIKSIFEKIGLMNEDTATIFTDVKGRICLKEIKF